MRPATSANVSKPPDWSVCVVLVVVTSVTLVTVSDFERSKIPTAYFLRSSAPARPSTSTTPTAGSTHGGTLKSPTDDDGNHWPRSGSGCVSDCVAVPSALLPNPAMLMTFGPLVAGAPVAAELAGVDAAAVS